MRPFCAVSGRGGEIMAISKDSNISAADVNSVINAVQTTYKKYGWSGTATTVSEGVAASAAAINAAINKLNSAISDSVDRRFYYFKGSTKVGTVSSGTALSAAKLSEISTTNTSVAKDYCNCDDDCNCDPNCCDYYCSCDSDCCDINCICERECSCDSDCCDSDCCVTDGACYDCSCDGDGCDCDADSWDECTDCCDSDDCYDCCDSDY